MFVSSPLLVVVIEVRKTRDSDEIISGRFNGCIGLYIYCVRIVAGKLIITIIIYQMCYTLNKSQIANLNVRSATDCEKYHNLHYVPTV